MPLPKKLKANKTAKVPETYDEALEAALKQEEQGDRYSTGDKAERHYRSALDLYRLAISFDSSKADAHYNAGRVLQTLVNFVEMSDSRDTLEQAVKLYHSAQTLDPFSIDAKYNKALAMIELGDWTEEEDRLSEKVKLWTEARSLLETVITTQVAAISSSEHEAPVTEDGVEESTSQADADMQEESEEISAVVSDPITPSDVIESLLALTNLLSDMQALTSDQAEREALSTSISSAFAQAHSMTDGEQNTDLFSIQRAELTFAISALERNTVSPSAIPDLLQRCQTLVNSHPEDKELLSEYADALSTCAQTIYPTDKAQATTLANLALTQYASLIQSLSSPLSRHGFSPHLIQPTLSTAHLQGAILNLLLQNISKAEEHAFASISTCGAGITWNGSKFGKIEGRKDRAAIKALYSAVVIFARVCFFSGNWRDQVVELMRNLKMDQQVVRREVEGEYVGDAIWSEGEAKYWEELVIAVG